MVVNVAINFVGMIIFVYKKMCFVNMYEERLLEITLKFVTFPVDGVFDMKVLKWVKSTIVFNRSQPLSIQYWCTEKAISLKHLIRL